MGLRAPGRSAAGAGLSGYDALFSGILRKKAQQPGLLTGQLAKLEARDSPSAEADRQSYAAIPASGNTMASYFKGDWHRPPLPYASSPAGFAGTDVRAARAEARTGDSKR